jgi:hypothetical protein
MSKNIESAAIAFGAIVAVFAIGWLVIFLNPIIPRTVLIDGCEYISSPVYGGRTLAHKGNCTNSVHLK